ncbi:histidine kinase [Ideonella sp. DXS29W]|uniref:Histidine kinase n=1 Tax=Ideonella lacteola TaxID=2984193 RepID=A0ABU9BIF8_9BURK
MNSSLSTELLKRSWRSWASTGGPRQGPYWLQLVWTALFAIPCALAFTGVGFALYARGAVWRDPALWGEWLRVNLSVSLFISLCIGYTIQGLYELLFHLVDRRRIDRLSEGRKALVFIAVPLVGVALAWPLSVWILRRSFSQIDMGGASPSINLGFIVFSLMFSLVMYLYFGGKARVEQANRRAAEAQLRLLQGQIEPHFLFNTLANVVGLIDADPTRARRMLESFIDYLRASLGGLRNPDHTLGHEMALVDAYLRVLSMRMEDRLRVRLDVPADLLALPIPPVVVQPLVENAIHHGLEPKVEGGEVLVRAHLADGRLHIDVIDDGLGLPSHPAPGRRGGAGAAVANIRERLHTAFGDAAQLSLSNRAEGGVHASLTIPCPTSPSH